ncbi:MAG: hypothetical protein R8G66_07850 [Cytophagales bacterium]|nr:hypothetical protein [Cytophagales bacterium]
MYRIFLFIICGGLCHISQAQGITLGTINQPEGFTSFANTKIFVLESYRNVDHMKQVVNDDPDLKIVEDYNFWVERGVLTSWLKYAGVESWADHVLEANYPLPKLEEVKAFINTNKHLPGVPSVQEMKMAGGQSMKAIDRILLTKIEELYLYQIEEEKKLSQLQVDEAMDEDRTLRWLSELGKELDEALPGDE